MTQQALDYVHVKNSQRLLAWSTIPGDRVVVGALIACTLLGLVLVLGRRGYDDPYITYRYAANLLNGHGLVYNEGQRVLSTTAPLYALLLAGLGTLWPDLAVVSNVVSALALVAAALALSGMARKRGETAAAWIVLLFVPVSSLLTRTFGAETCLYVALIVVAFGAYEASSWPLAAFLAALATMLRADGVLVAVAMVVVHLLRRRRLPWRAVLIYVALTGAWFGGLWLYFGSPIPVTLASKQHQGLMSITTDFAPGLVEMARLYLRFPLFWLHTLVASVGLGRVLARQRHWLPLLVWTGLYVVAYSLLRVGTYFWYYGPLLPALVVLLAEGIVALARGLTPYRVPRAAIAGGAALLTVLLLASLLWDSMWHGSRPDQRWPPSVAAGRWIATHTPHDATIGMLEIGVLGYYAEREVVDFAGLLQPDVARQLTVTTTYEDSARWAIEQYRPDYVILPGGAMLGLLNSTSFQAAYAPIQVFSAGEAFSLVLYQQGAEPAATVEPTAANAQPTTAASLPFWEQVDQFLSRLAAGRPYIFGNKWFYAGLGAVYAVMVGVFLVKLGQALVDEPPGEP